MNKYLCALAASSVLLVGCQPSESNVTLDTNATKASYGIGLSLGKRIGADQVEIDINAMKAGLSDGLSGAEQRLSDEDIAAALQAFQEEQMQKQQAIAMEKSSKNKAEGEAFLAANAEKEGVVVTDSGLQYIVIEAGEGEKPTAEDQVKVHYTGTLIDGTVFDSSVQRGEPITFPLNGVIRGWTEGVQLMSPGAKYKFFIPSDLAYGPAGAGKDIGPDATLIFDVELIAVE